MLLSPRHVPRILSLSRFILDVSAKGLPSPHEGRGWGSRRSLPAQTLSPAPQQNPSTEISRGVRSHHYQSLRNLSRPPPPAAPPTRLVAKPHPPVVASPRSADRATTPATSADTSSSRPRSRITAGTRIIRTIVASSRIATASPNPICCRNTSRPVLNPRKTTTMISAAPVMIRAVDSTPCATDSRLSPV